MQLAVTVSRFALQLVHLRSFVSVENPWGSWLFHLERYACLLTPSGLRPADVAGSTGAVQPPGGDAVCEPLVVKLNDASDALAGEPLVVKVNDASDALAGENTVYVSVNDASDALAGENTVYVLAGENILMCEIVVGERFAADSSAWARRFSVSTVAKFLSATPEALPLGPPPLRVYACMVEVVPVALARAAVPPLMVAVWSSLVCCQRGHAPRRRSSTSGRCAIRRRPWDFTAVHVIWEKTGRRQVSF